MYSHVIIQSSCSVLLIFSIPMLKPLAGCACNQSFICFMILIILICWYDIHDAAQVRKEIEDETDRETGRSKQISSVPIHLSIFSPNGKIWGLITYQFYMKFLSNVHIVLGYLKTQIKITCIHNLFILYSYAFFCTFSLLDPALVGTSNWIHFFFMVLHFYLCHSGGHLLDIHMLWCIKRFSWSN